MGEFDPFAVAETVDRLYEWVSKQSSNVFPKGVHTQMVSASLAREHFGGKASTDKKRNIKLRRVLNQLVVEGRLIAYSDIGVVFHARISEAQTQGGCLRRVKCFRPPSLLVKLAWAAS